MKKTKVAGILIFSCLIIGNSFAQTRLMNKIKDKTEDKIIEKIFDENSNDQSQTNSDNNSGNNNTSNSNSRGEGLSSTAPDVNKNIDAALLAYKNKNYSETRFSIRQAIQGIELEMGSSVLKSLPESVNGLDVSKENDKVTSTGIGFAGLVIERLYSKSDQDIRITIANNSVWLSSVNMYLQGGYSSSTEQNRKQVKVQGYNAVIEYDESSGYKLSVPFGQSSIFVMECVNFENEQKVMSAADKFNIDSIKKQLGEQ